MNNTRRRTLAISAILAVTLVVGMLAAIPTTTQPAYAYLQKKIAHDDKGNHNGKGNGNTDTDTNQNCNNKASASGLDPEVNQDCEPLICTHPDNNAICSQEAVVTLTAPVNKTCEQCFTSILTPQQITAVIQTGSLTSVAALCADLTEGLLSEVGLRTLLFNAGITSSTTQNELIACLREAGISFT